VIVLYIEVFNGYYSRYCRGLSTILRNTGTDLPSSHCWEMESWLSSKMAAHFLKLQRGRWVKRGEDTIGLRP